jgi:hypothetical protein
MTAYAGPLPDIAHFKGHGLAGILITCTNCSRMSVMGWEKLGRPDSTPLPDLDRLKRFACSGCGRRQLRSRPTGPSTDRRVRSNNASCQAQSWLLCC